MVTFWSIFLAIDRPDYEFLLRSDLLVVWGNVFDEYGQSGMYKFKIELAILKIWLDASAIL